MKFVNEGTATKGVSFGEVHVGHLFSTDKEGRYIYMKTKPSEGNNCVYLNDGGVSPVARDTPVFRVEGTLTYRVEM